MMKFKPNQTRTYDREGYKKRAACLCFRNEREDEGQSLLIDFTKCCNEGSICKFHPQEMVHKD